MAVTISYTNKFKEALINGEMVFGLVGSNQGSPNTYKIILMASGFTFNEDTQDTYANISASELTGLYGYTTGGATINPLTISRDNSTNKMIITYPTITWTATGGDIGTTPGAFIYNDTHASKVTVCYINFGGNQTAFQGGVFSISNGKLELV